MKNLIEGLGLVIVCMMNVPTWRVWTALQAALILMLASALCLVLAPAWFVWTCIRALRPRGQARTAFTAEAAENALNGNGGGQAENGRENE